MFATLNAHNGFFARVGNPQTQPVTDDLAYDVKKQATTQAAQGSQGVLPAHEAAINTAVLALDGASSTLVTNPSLQSISLALASQTGTLVPPFHSTFNSISPSYAQNLEPTAGALNTSAQLSLAAKQFEPYEQLTGISQERPEIVALTDFLPIFNKDVSHSHPPFIDAVEAGGIYLFMTDAGKFIDMHIQARSLRHVNQMQLIRILKSKYAHVQKAISDNRTAFQKSVDSLADLASFFLTFVRGLDQIRAQLDLRNDLHVVDPIVVASSFIKVNTRGQSADLSAVAALNLIKQYVPSTYTAVDTLVRLGYVAKSVRLSFSSTKIWMQLLLELSQILKSHSLEFLDVDPVKQRIDVSPVALTRANTSPFQIRSQLPALPTLDAVVSTQVNTSVAVVNSIATVYKTIYEDVHFKTEETRIAALLNLVTKEFRYSLGMQQPATARVLKDFYGFSPQSSGGNAALFDQVLGSIGNNITDVPTSDVNTLVSLAQKSVGTNSLVLTLESKYIDGSTGTLTPGGTYYVDSVLDTDGKTFNTSLLDSLGSELETAARQFSVVVDGLNLLVQPVTDARDPTFSARDTIVSSPVDMLNRVCVELFDLQTGDVSAVAASDNLVSVYAQATKNNTVKAILFLFTMAKISRAYSNSIPFLGSDPSADNTPLTDALIERLLSTIETTVPQTQTGNQALVNKLLGGASGALISIDAVRSSLKNGTDLTRLVESVLALVIEVFRFKNQGVNGNRTRFSDYPDTAFAMAAFDMIIAIVAKYGNQKLVATTYGQSPANQGILSFLVGKSTVNNLSSYSSLLTRIKREVSLTYQVIFGVLNTLQRLSGAIKNYSNYLKSQSTLDKLKKVSSIIGDPTVLKMLMSEQQIMLMASTAFDLYDKLQKQQSVATSAADSDGSFDVDDEIKVLDDSALSPVLKNAIYGMFGSGDFASAKGFNKKIMTVGIPQGFTQKLKQRISVSTLQKSSFVDKQSDIVKVSIYRVDQDNPDIVYKPMQFLFELSRFAVRNDALFSQLPVQPTVDDIVQAIPTRDFGQGTSIASSITYWRPRGKSVPKGYKASFDDLSYAFLTEANKAEIARNHVVSYVLESYVRVLTGVSLADQHFDLVQPQRPGGIDVSKLLTEARVHQVSTLLSQQSQTSPESQQPTGGVLFSSTVTKPAKYVPGARGNKASARPKLANSSGIAGSVALSVQHAAVSDPNPAVKTLKQQADVNSMNSNLAKLSHRKVPQVLHDFRTLSAINNTVSTVSDPLAVSGRIIQPKQFDRVFNVIFDPDDFDIDYDATVATPFGKDALHQLLSVGDVVTVDENALSELYLRSGDNSVPSGARSFAQDRFTSNVGAFQYRERDKSEGDLTFDKYFVVIETFGSEEVE